MPGTPEAVVYEQSVASAKHQIDLIKDLRGRAGVLLSVASVTTAFLGGQALADDRSFSFLVWVAVLAYVAVGVLTIAILWPRNWLYELSAQTMLEDIGREGMSERDVHSHLALVIDKNVDANHRVLGPLFWIFRVACVVLVLGVVSWLALLADL